MPFSNELATLKAAGQRHIDRANELMQQARATGDAKLVVAANLELMKSGACLRRYWEIVKSAN